MNEATPRPLACPSERHAADNPCAVDCAVCRDECWPDIVKAVNAHDALVNAATQIVTEFDEWGSVLQVGYDDDMGEYGPTSAIEQLRTALEAAK
tara:strand:+ start:265 stop:546 length:282 start_codon:yes stop_codon:yes gene_type:complete